MSRKESVKVKERKLAIIMITTHGGKSSLEEDKKNHDGKITVRKINATSDSVCNFTSPDGLNEMIGQRMNEYIADNNKEEKKDCNRRGISYNPDNILCLYGTAPEQLLQIQHFSESLRTFMTKIDDVHTDTKKHIVREAKGKRNDNFWESFEGDAKKDPDLLRFIESIPTSYQLEKWGVNHRYIDKTYLIKRDELVSDDISPHDNTIILLGKTHLPQASLSQLPVGPITRSDLKKEDIEFRLSDILKQLEESGYTDTIIIDLSCNVGEDPRHGRSLVRAAAAEAEARERAGVKSISTGAKKIKATGGGKRKSKKSTRKSKRTRKHRKK